MAKNKDVAKWYETPFQHMRYTLVRNQKQMNIALKCIDKKQKIVFLDGGASARVNFFDDDSAIVQIGNQEHWSLNAVHGLLLHEAQHIWQELRKKMGEEDPSSEFEAYSVQRIAQDLFDMYDESKE